MTEARKGLIELVKKRAAEDRVIKGSQILSDAKDCNFIIVKKTIDPKSHVVRFKVIDIEDNFNLILRGKGIIDEKLCNIADKDYNKYKFVNGNANEKLSHILLREGYPKLDKHKVYLRVLKPGSGDLLYALIGWDKEEFEYV